MLAPSAGITQFESQAIAQNTNGMAWWDSTQHGISAYLAGVQQQLSAVIYVATASAGPNNTTTETSLIGAGVGTKTIPANFLLPGKSARLQGSGIITTSASPPATITFKLKLGSVILATANFAPPANMANNAVSIDIRVVCRSAGVSGTVIPDGALTYATYLGATANGTRNFVDMNNLSAVSTVDTTSPQVLDLTATWSSAVSGNLISIGTLNIEVLD